MFFKCAFINNQHFAFLHRSKTENAEAYKECHRECQNRNSKNNFCCSPIFCNGEKRSKKLKNSIGVTNAAITVWPDWTIFKSVWCPFFVQIFGDLSGSPGLVVMGEDSFSEGRGFESQHRKLDGRFHKYFALKRKWTKKRPGVAHFKIFGDFWWYLIMSKFA